MSELALLTWDDAKFEFQRKLGNFVQYFQVNLPINGNGIPLQIIDPLIIAEKMYDCETTDDMPEHIVEVATLNVDFEDGVPIVDGTPIWERFDGEPIDYYKLFKEYREMFYTAGSRAIAKLATQSNILGRNLNALAKVYHWQVRCKAYDMYKKMELLRKREMAIQKLETRHGKAADRMLEQAMTYLEEHPEQMNPKVAVQMIQLAMKAGRLALGLNAEKPGSGDNGPNIHINQTSHAGGGNEVSSSVEIGGAPGKTDARDLSDLQSILHILDKSGALDKVKVVDAEYSVVPDEESEESA